MTRNIKLNPPQNDFRNRTSAFSSGPLNPQRCWGTSSAVHTRHFTNVSWKSEFWMLFRSDPDAEVVDGSTSYQLRGFIFNRCAEKLEMINRLLSTLRLSVDKIRPHFYGKLIPKKKKKKKIIKGSHVCLFQRSMCTEDLILCNLIMCLYNLTAYMEEKTTTKHLISSF